MRHDVVVWGATGFTGELVAEYLLREEGVGKGLRWAIAGRDAAKLDAVRERLASQDPAAREIPILVANADDPASLRALAAQARVIATTVGPYARHGLPMVAACVAEGTDYCDITGEPQFMRASIDGYDAAAREAGVRIVHTCGFDSIPSDLGCLLVQEHAIATRGAPLPRVRAYVRRMRGGASGGTIASMGELMAQAGDKKIRKILADPYSLLPADAPRGPRVSDFPAVSWDAEEGSWVAPFVMASTNGKVVRRSNALMAQRYGEDFQYQEVAGFRPGPRGFAGATAAMASVGGIATAMSIGWVRRFLLERVLPKPGEGPDAAARAAGRFEFHVVGRDARGEGARVIVRGDKDPGYGATSGMLAEAALCLALDRERLPERFGVLTPAAGLGVRLAERLPRAGVTFAVLPEAAV